MTFLMGLSSKCSKMTGLHTEGDFMFPIDHLIAEELPGSYSTPFTANVFQKLKDIPNFLSGKNDIFMGLYTDGWQNTNRRGHTLTTIMFQVLNLPVNVRY
jgi:hypothetical protein